MAGYYEIEGTLMSIIFMPKNFNITVKRRNTKNIITNPITAAVMVLRAPSTAALSPPE